MILELFIIILYRVSHKKGIDKKLLIGSAHGFNSHFFECKFCLVYHLIDPFPKRHRLVHNSGFPKF